MTSARSVTATCRDKAVVIQNVATSDRHVKVSLLAYHNIVLNVRFRWKRDQLASLLLPIEALLISPDVIRYEYLYSVSALRCFEREDT